MQYIFSYLLNPSQYSSTGEVPIADLVYCLCRSGIDAQPRLVLFMRSLLHQYSQALERSWVDLPNYVTSVEVPRDCSGCRERGLKLQPRTHCKFCTRPPLHCRARCPVVPSCAVLLLLRLPCSQSTPDQCYFQSGFVVRSCPT